MYMLFCFLPRRRVRGKRVPYVYRGGTLRAANVSHGDAAAADRSATFLQKRLSDTWYRYRVGVSFRFLPAKRPRTKTALVPELFTRTENGIGPF